MSQTNIKIPNNLHESALFFGEGGWGGTSNTNGGSIIMHFHQMLSYSILLLFLLEPGIMNMF